jgi:hypothetical protein
MAYAKLTAMKLPIGSGAIDREPLSDIMTRWVAVTVQLQDIIEGLAFQSPVLPPSSYLQHIIGFFGLFYLSQEFFRLAVNTIHQLLIGIGDSAASQNGLSQSAENAYLDGAKP